jgi:hypothetical protein
LSVVSVALLRNAVTAGQGFAARTCLHLPLKVNMAGLSQPFRQQPYYSRLRAWFGRLKRLGWLQDISQAIALVSR